MTIFNKIRKWRKRKREEKQKRDLELLREVTRKYMNMELDKKMLELHPPFLFDKEDIKDKL